MKDAMAHSVRLMAARDMHAWACDSRKQSCGLSGMLAKKRNAVDAVAYHADLADVWEQQYQQPAFRDRASVLEGCLSDNLCDQQWLDAGCGSGTLTRQLAKRGCHVVGMDAAGDMITVARTLSTNCERIRFEQIETVAVLPLLDASLDGILCSSVMEYLPDPVGCLTEFARVLRPEGRLIVTVPNRRSLVRRWHRSLHCMGRLMGRPWCLYLDHSHNDYTSKGFRVLLDEQGFVTHKIMPFGVGGNSLLGFSCSRRLL